MGAKNGFGLWSWATLLCLGLFKSPMVNTFACDLDELKTKKTVRGQSTFFQTSTHAETDVDPEYFITKEQTDMYRCLYQQFFN